MRPQATPSFKFKQQATTRKCSRSTRSKQELDARDGMARRGVHLIIRFPGRLRVPKANLLPKIFGGVVEAVDELGDRLGGWDQHAAALPCWYVHAQYKLSLWMLSQALFNKGRTRSFCNAGHCIAKRPSVCDGGCGAYTSRLG